MIKNLKVNIDNLDDSTYPIMATCSFKNLKKETCTIHEKLDILSENILKVNSIPLSGYFLKCKILDESEVAYLIDISIPYGVISLDNKSVFWVDKSLISDKHFDQT